MLIGNRSVQQTKQLKGPNILPGFHVGNKKRVLLQGLGKFVANFHRCEPPSIVSAGWSREHRLDKIRETLVAQSEEVIIFTEKVVHI